MGKLFTGEMLVPARHAVFPASASTSSLEPQWIIEIVAAFSRVKTANKSSIDLAAIRNPVSEVEAAVVRGLLAELYLSRFLGEHRLETVLDKMAGWALSSDDPDVPDHVTSARLFIEARAVEPRFLPRHVAKHAGRPLRQLSGAFLRHVGCTLSAYIHRQRILIAMHLLSETSEQTKVVASKVGYSSTSRFDCRFKRHTGMTPKFYRECRRKAPLRFG